MEFRKLIKFGTSSHVISIPNRWLKKNQLNKGDFIYINENGHNELILSPEKKETIKFTKEIVINIEKKSLERLNREIISAYLNDFNTIKLKGRDLSKISTVLKNRIQNLMGMEIIDQNNEIITSKDLLDIKEVSMFSLSKRMDLITRTMFSDILEQKEKIDFFQISNKDDAINRLYFTAMRFIKRAFDDPNFNNNPKLDDSQLLKMWHFINQIELIADLIKLISYSLNKTGSKKINLESFFDSFSAVQKLYIDSMKAFYKNDIETAYTLAKLKDELLKNNEKLCENCKNKDLCVMFEKLNFLIFDIHRITRRVYS